MAKRKEPILSHGEEPWSSKYAHAIPHLDEDGVVRYYDPPAMERIRESERQREATALGADLSVLHGSAKLLTSTGLDQREVLSSQFGANGVPIGRGLVWSMPALQGHAVTFGATRSGKGVQSIIPALLSYTGSMVVIDPKGENAWATAERRRRMGQRVVILDPWGEVNRRYGSKASPPVVEQTTRFNPLSAIDPGSEDFADDVGAIADALVLPGTGDPHWSDSAKELIGGLIASRVMHEPGKAHLGDVRRAITADDDRLAEMIEDITERDPDSLAAGKLRRFNRTTGTEISSIRSTALTQTAILDSRRLIEAMQTGEPPFNLDELATGRVTLYLVLPLDRLKTHGRWLRLILTMAIRAIARQEEPPEHPVLFLLDEMGTVGGLTMIEQAFGLMAGVGIRVWAFLQDVNQLKRDYPESWETFISNASLIQALKVTDISTSDYLSKLLGDTTLERMSAESLRLRQRNPQHKAMADQVHGRALLLPQEIRALPADKVLSIVPGTGNFLLPREPYFAPDSCWRGMYRSPPRFAVANAAPPPPVPPPSEPSKPSKRRGLFG